MSNIFDNDEDFAKNDNFKTNNEYAKNYNTWRNKEEQNRLKTKYGEDIEVDDSSSSSDDEDVDITPSFDFLKTLAYLKSKDPSIYDKNVQFCQGDSVPEKKPKKKKKDQPMYLKDYERNIILEKGGVLSDEEEFVDEDRPRSPTYIEEQNRIKEGFKGILENSDDEEGDDWGGIFKQRQKSKEETEKEEVDYINWLAGKKTNLDNKEVEKELKPLKDYWSNPSLDEGEKFLRDYILNKGFLEKEVDDEYVPTYDEIVHDSDEDLSSDERNIEKQEEFEHKFNFRFEEPDQEFIKRYPRTVETSLRKKDDRRKVKRQEVKERKRKEKDEKMQELKKLQELKRQEIEEKLEKLKEITGNESLGFAGDDIDGEFDPEEHDKKMQALFNDEFYSVEEGEQKPQFPELDEELEIENWERYDGEKEEESGTLWDDENFNMDCDYDPHAQIDPTENGKSRKKRKRKSKFAAALSKPKPKYDPNDKNYEKYFDEYYKLDCEDIVGDIPCRFKYRKVVPNDFGLSAEEILLANERELNKWCSLKKAVQIRPDHIEKYDQIAYRKKSQNINLKMKILPSLFSREPDNTDLVADQKNEEKRIGTNEEEQTCAADANGITRKEEEATVVAVQENEDEKMSENGKTSSKKKQKKKVSGILKQVGEENVSVSNKTSKKKKKLGVLTKKKILPSLLSKEPDNTNQKKENVMNAKSKTIRKGEADTSFAVQESGDKRVQENGKTSLKKKRKNEVSGVLQQVGGENVTVEGVVDKTRKKKKNKKKKPEASKALASSILKNRKPESENSVQMKSSKKRKRDGNETTSKNPKKFKKLHDNDVTKISDARLSAYGINPKKFKNKLKYAK